MDMRVISADSHMMEPADLWETRLDSKFRDRAPKVIKSESGKGYLFIAPGVRPFPVAGGFGIGKSGEELKEHLKKGYEAARAAGAKVIAVFAAASERFSRANINCSVAESIERFKPVVSRAMADGIKVRGYVSCVLGCPYEGEVQPRAVVDMAEVLWNLGCYEISLGDTIGVGTQQMPGQTGDALP